MAKIKLPSYLKEGNGRMEDAVLTRWKGISYMKPYRKPKDAQTQAQVEIRSAFSSVVADWGYLSGIVHTAWNKSVEGQDLTGYNAFIGTNSEYRRKGEILELCPAYGEEMVINFTAAAGSVGGTISCSFAPLAAGKHLTLFIRKNVTEGKANPVIRQDCGADPVSPVTVSSLKAGAAYSVYAVVTDAVYAEAKSVSQSAGGKASAA